MKLIILSHSPVCHVVCSLGQFLVGWQIGYSAEDKLERHNCLNIYTVLNSKINKQINKKLISMHVQQRKLLHKFLLLKRNLLLCNNNKYFFILEFILLNITNMNNII
jgi:hypothetical protein